jgi:carotenoid cleavage dioxygenase-like enzyme
MPPQADAAAAAVGTANPYLEGRYAPVLEERSVDALEVVGSLPEELDGVYVRNGPNPRFDAPGRYHWFDGDGMLHAVRFRGGRASYRNRWVRTRALQRELGAGRALWSGVMEPAAGNPRDMPLKDTANTDVVAFGDRLLALWYLTGAPYAVDPLSLETLSVEDFDGTLRCDVSAHAKVDAQTGELLFFDYGPRPPYMRHGVVGPEGRVTHLVDIDLPGPRLPHDMAITERHSILMDLPLVNDPAAAREGRHRLLFDRDLPARFGILPRHGGGDTVRWFEAEPCYVYHTVNAWEDGDEVVLDLCRVKRPEIAAGSTGTLERMLSYLRLDAQLQRYRFDLRSGRTREEQLDDANAEFPSIDPARTGRRCRHAYAVHISPETTFLFDALMKYDLEGGTAETHALGPGRWGSESVFVPRAGGGGEDDGWVLAYVLDDATGRSEVIVLEAADFTAPPVARVLLPVRVPIGFHACWMPGSRVSAS